MYLPTAKECLKPSKDIFYVKNRCNPRKFLEDSSKLIKKHSVTKTMVCDFLINLSE